MSSSEEKMSKLAEYRAEYTAEKSERDIPKT